MMDDYELENLLYLLAKYCLSTFGITGCTQDTCENCSLFQMINKLKAQRMTALAAQKEQ